jgi:hypothetical protein
LLCKRELEVKMGSETKRASFEGRAVEVRF